MSNKRTVAIVGASLSGKTTLLESLLNAAYRAINIDINAQNTNSLARGINALLDGLWLECCLDPDAFSQTKNLKIIYKFVESTTGLNIKPA